ncbi:conserved hypothetical protein [Theileria equi strain WA]|uniref:Serine aminopeptidase S33 domain-containing protein n=1 Tax=Theileria equi strain WA TaxID=1537102 RepID=L1LAX0_THEEQ|nr:conserved hypothetical protein [Theileria equi strain WA]EKX72430.1 conserved hypothetical protein [Theileria equi strain WA]|eukprot:XP_004831882.1 conserved hypothetical protein [Theileria equi strain WA]
MRIFLILYVLLLGKTYSLVDSQGPREEVKDVTLNLSSPDSSFINVFTRRPYELFQTIHLARNGFEITSIVDDRTVLWKKNKDGNHCTHVTVLTDETTHTNIYLKDGEGVRNCFYLEKSGGEWKQTTGKEFYSRLHSMVKRNEDVDHVTLDISKTQDPRVFYVNKTSDFPFAVYAANSKCRIKKIKNGWTTTIWKDRAKNKGCMYVSFYPRKDPKWAYLLFLNSDGFREEFLGETKSACRNSWKAITRGEYLEGIRKAGFDESTFNNNITMDLSRPSDSFHTHSYIAGSCSERLFTPLPGLLLTSVIDGRNAVWTAKDGEYCTYANVYHYNNKPLAGFLLVKDNQGKRKVLYFAKSGAEWISVDKEGYFSVTSGNDPLAPPKEVVHELTMSSFKNRQGLRLTSYASRVENAKGDFVLAHGLSSLFMFTFCRKYYEWNCKTFGTPLSPYLGEPFIGRGLQKGSNVEKYGHLFEHAKLEGMDAFEAFPKYKYNNCFVEFLNGLGYNVYGYDLQSHGLSESVSEFRCSMDDFKDYVYDVLQFVSIVKRSKFDDPSETFDESSLYENTPTDKKTFLLGFSMGGNISMRAIQEFYKHAKEGAKSVDGLIGLSAMLSLEHYVATWTKWIMIQFYKLYAWSFPTWENSHDKLSRHGESFGNFTRHSDPFFLSTRMLLHTSRLLFSATEDANKDENMAHYPKDLPTLFLHTKDDATCHVNGPRRMVKEHLAGTSTAKFVELEGSCHYITSYQSLCAVIPHVKEWLNEHS